VPPLLEGTHSAGERGKIKSSGTVEFSADQRKYKGHNSRPTAQIMTFILVDFRSFNAFCV